MSAQENPVGLDSVHNENVQGASKIAQSVEGAQTVPTAPVIPPELRQAGAEQASLGNISGEPHPDVLKAVSAPTSDDPNTGRGWLDTLRNKVEDMQSPKKAA